MRRKRKPTIPQRERIFIGCEGLSELGYIQWLRMISDANKGYIHPISENLKGGSLVDMVEKAQVIFLRKNKEVPIKHKFLILDLDRGHNEPEELMKAKEKIEEYGFTVIWQSPNHEGFLLTHCEDFNAGVPMNKGDVDRLLLRHKPNYSKGMPKDKYNKAFNSVSLISAAEKNEELAKLLQVMKIIE